MGQAPKGKRALYVHLPEELYERLTKYAASQELSLVVVIKRAVMDYLSGVTVRIGKQ